MTNCFTRTEKQEEKTNEEIQETFFSIREQKIKKDAAGNGYLSDETIANRASDALLNYMEACYEKNGNLDAKAQSYWRAFRERAHPDTDYNKTIAATVMSEDTFDREITPLKRIRDNYPKYIITMDEMPMDEDGIKIINVIDFLLKN